MLLDEEEDYRHDLEEETDYYNTIIREGGRPSHPVNLGCDILEDPGEYREILSYWQLHNGDGENRKWKVFRSQMSEWQIYLEYRRKHRQEGRFPTYATKLESTFARHEFTRPYKLDKDLERQDKLTTWIEFLGYEYSIYDTYVANLRLRQAMYDEAWKELVDSQVLRPHETEEFVCSTASKYQHAGEEKRASSAVESAKSAVRAAEKAITELGLSKLPERDPRNRLAAAQSELDSAIKSLELIKRRNDLVYEFFTKTGQMKLVNNKIMLSYQGIKKKAERRTILLRWILQQIPLLELELSLSKVPENNASQENPGKRKSKRNRADESDEERDSKRQKQDGERSSISHRRTRAPTAEEPVSLLKRNDHEPPDKRQSTKRRKRDGQTSRVSAYETSKIADFTSIGEPLSVQPSTPDDSRINAARSVNSHHIRRAVPKKSRLEANKPAKVVLDGRARVIKKGRGAGKSSEVSALGSRLRRSARLSKAPDRFK